MDVTEQRRRVISHDSLVVVAVTFLVTFSVLSVAIAVATITGALDPVMLLTARVAKTLISWAGIGVSLQGNRLLLANHTLQIDVECTAITIAALYTSLLVAYPLSLKTRAMGLAVGIPVIAGANFIRLFLVALASGTLSAAGFAFMHDYVYKVGMVLVVLGMWAVWLQSARANAQAS